MNSAKSGYIPWIGSALGVLAGVVYLLTLSSGAYPGESANLIAQHGGLTPILSTTNPLWSLIAWMLAHLPIGSLATRLNVFSVLCAATAIGLFYHIVAGTIYGAVEERTPGHAIAGTAAMMGGIAACLFLAFSIPFWIVANRAHTASFDILLLCIVTSLFLSYTRNFSKRILLLFAFLYGLGTVEFSTFIVLGPVFAGFLFFVLWSERLLTPQLIIRVILFYMLGLLLYVVSASRFYMSDAREFQQVAGFWQIIWMTWRNQYFLIMHSLPKLWWLMLILVSIIPWVTCLMVGKRGLNAEKEWSYYILHAAMTALTLAALFNVKIAPWRLSGIRTLLVTPYVLLASVYGYLVAYWYLLPVTVWSTEKPFNAMLKKWLGPILIAPALLAVCIAPFLNLPVANARSAKSINVYVRSIVADLEGRSWLFSDGLLDNNIIITAAEMKKPLRVFNLALGNNETYMRYVSSFMDNDRLKSMTQVGMGPLLLEWFAGDRDIEKKAAVFSAADLWITVGLTPFPNKTVFLGLRDSRGIDVRQLVGEHQKFWDEVVPLLKKTRDSKDPFAPLVAEILLRHASMMANNMGVLLADLGHTNEAFAAYAKSREISPDNISALLNQYSMIESGFVTDGATVIKIRKDLDELREVTAKLQQEQYIHRLVRCYGFIRTSEAFASLGWAFSLSGDANLAEAGLRKAIDLGPKDGRRVKEALAFLYLTQNQDSQSEALYRELVEKNPKDAAPYLGLARIAASKGDFKTAASMLETAESKGAPKNQTDMEWATFYLMKNDVPKARSILEGLVNRDPDLPDAWFMLAGVLIQQRDQSEMLDECVKKLAGMKGQDFSVAVVLGQIALSKNDQTDARKHLERALVFRPSALTVLEPLLKLDLSENNYDAATTRIRGILSLDPGHAFANCALGMLQTGRKEYDLAESSFRRSLEREKTLVALNNLSSVLMEKGSYVEAEKLARAALEMKSNVREEAEVYDTLALILMKTKQLGEAEKALEKSLSLFDGNMHVQMHMAELQMMKGNKNRAMEMLEKVSANRDNLSAKDKIKLKALYRADRKI
jgi:Tfp pilus assembly protein PilF